MYIQSNITTWRQSGAEHDPKTYQSTQETYTLSQPISPLRFALPNWVKNSRASACAAQNMLIKKAKDHHLSTRDRRARLSEGGQGCVRAASANLTLSGLAARKRAVSGGESVREGCRDAGLACRVREPLHGCTGGERRHERAWGMSVRAPRQPLGDEDRDRLVAAQHQRPHQSHPR